MRPFGMLYGSYYIPPGDAGTLATLDKMVEVARAGAISPDVRRVAAALVADTDRDPMLHASLLGNWVIQHCEFLPDPTTDEALLPAWDAIRAIIENGNVQCDCDDVAILAASLGLSIGLQARFVAVGFDSDPLGPFAHVWTDLGNPSGREWLTVDPEADRLIMPPITRSQVVEV